MKKRYTAIITVILMAALCLLALVSCTKELSVPENIALGGRTLTWDGVKGAEAYIVNINDTEYEVNENSLLLPDGIFGEISVSVKAIGKKAETEFSAPMRFIAVLQLPAPANIRQEGSRLVWDEVPGASGYVVKVDGAEYLVDTNGYNLPAGRAAVIQVLAAGRSDGTVISGPYSAEFTVKIPLSAPANLKESSGVVSWDAVPNAGKYLVSVNGSEKEVSSASISIKYDYSGAVNVKVKALSGSAQYVDSAYSEESSFTLAKVKMPTPQNVAISSGELVFDAVYAASGYEIFFNGASVATVTENKYAIPSQFFDEEGGYLQVRTLSSVHFPSELSANIVLKVTVINDEAELRNMSPAGSYVLSGDIALTSPWQPIAVFSGVLDGGGYTVSGIIIQAGARNTGFFGELNGAAIRNLTLEGSIDVSLSDYEARIGGLAGFSADSTVSGVSVRMDITAVSHNGIGRVGGAIGSMSGTALSSVSYSGEISAENLITGGLVGAAASSDAEAQIYRSSAQGKITVSGGYQSYAGGLVGQMTDNFLIVSECFANVDLTGSGIAGGFAGYVGSGKIENSYSKGKTASVNGSIIKLGGFIGVLAGYNAKISDCISMAEVITPSASGENIHTGAFAGNTVGGTYGGNVYSDCIYNSSLSPMDRIGNTSGDGAGRGDGIEGVPETSLLDMSGSSYDANIWSFINGSMPKLMWQE